MLVPRSVRPERGENCHRESGPARWESPLGEAGSNRLPGENIRQGGVALPDRRYLARCNKYRGCPAAYSRIRCIRNVAARPRCVWRTPAACDESSSVFGHQRAALRLPTLPAFLQSASVPDPRRSCNELSGRCGEPGRSDRPKPAIRRRSGRPEFSSIIRGSRGRFIRHRDRECAACVRSNWREVPARTSPARWSGVR